MDKLYTNLKGYVKVAKKPLVDNLVFRLHYKVTLIILITFSILVTGKQFFGEPIHCISKDDIPSELLETYCWIHTTFSLDGAWFKKVGSEVPYPGVDKHTQGEVKVYHAYYQWVCFVLFLQSLSFYIARYIWKHYECHRMQNLSSKLNLPTTEDPVKERRIACYLYKNRENHYYYAMVHMFAEIINFVNVVAQIFITNEFLGREFTTYGIKVAQFTEWDWTLRYDPMMKVFPRMTKCTFHRFGSSGDVQKHDALCLLPINIINEKVYVFLWFWFVILAILSGLALIYRIVVNLSSRARFYSIYWRCNRHVNYDELRTALDSCDRYTWFVWSLLCKNMDNQHFQHIITEFCVTRYNPCGSGNAESPTNDNNQDKGKEVEDELAKGSKVLPPLTEAEQSFKQGITGKKGV